MSDVIVKVEGLSKRYRIGAPEERHDTLRDQLVSNFKALCRREVGHAVLSGSVPIRSDTIWALRDVSFEVKRGEVLGIIGKNGAGKSTLLKILSQITAPTDGRIEVDGRVASLLEVGTGFHPELTGRENIYLNGAILGMKKAEIKKNFDEIVAFAEIEKFLDTPVKRYSSGMYVRLAFAVAAHLEPEILIVDEVLAVGDSGFQRKCLGKIGEVTKSGRTVLMVSHNMEAILNFGHRALLLDSGRLVHEGAIAEVVSRYLKTGEDVNRFLPPNKGEGEGDARAVFSNVEVFPNPPRTGEPVEFVFTIARSPHSKSTLSTEVAIDFLSQEGIRILQVYSRHMGKVVEIPPRGLKLSVKLESMPLVPGYYPAYLWIGTGNIPVHFLRNSFTLRVEPGCYREGEFVDNRGYPVVVRSTWREQGLNEAIPQI